MSIEEQFNLIAKEYDVNRRKFIPCFEDYYVSSTDFIASNIPAPKRILDLGAGTGLLSFYWHRRFPKSEYVLTDISEEMLNIARNRFHGLENVSFEITDYKQALPTGSFDCIISALSIHHLTDREKAELFSKIYKKLLPEGIFVNYDQFCGGSSKMDAWLDNYWVKKLEGSGLSDTDISLWKERRKLDRECSVEKETEMLRACGFTDLKTVYLNQKFAVIAALK